MKRMFFLLVAVALSMVAISAACSGECAVKCKKQANESSAVSLKAAETVEIIYFHGKQRCPTCMAIESESKALVDNELVDQVITGRVKMVVVDFSTEEGKAIASKYKISFSSLLIVAKKGSEETVEDLTRYAFANARSNAEVFRENLKAKVLAYIQ